jgi:cytoskeletal protein CcmA (bactofilin family)
MAVGTIGVPISQLPAVSVVGNSDVYPLVQAGVTMRATTEQITANCLKIDGTSPTITGPLTIVGGDLTVDGNTTITGNMLLDNNQILQWKDAGGATQNVLWVDSSDNTHLSDAGGNNITLAPAADGTYNLGVSNTTVALHGGNTGGGIYVNSSQAVVGFNNNATYVNVTSGQTVVHGNLNADAELSVGGSAHIGGSVYYPSFGSHAFGFSWDGSFLHSIVDGSDTGQLATVSWAQTAGDGRYLRLTGGTLSSDLTVHGTLLPYVMLCTSFAEVGYIGIAYPGVAPAGKYYFAFWYDGATVYCTVDGVTNIPMVARDTVEALEHRLQALEQRAWTTA